MFQLGDIVEDQSTSERGKVVYMWEGNVRVRFDVDRTTDYSSQDPVLRKVEDALGRSYPLDIVHAAMLRHAVNAGAAITALEIIRRDALEALRAPAETHDERQMTTLQFIQKFCDDVLSQVLPA